MVWSEGAGNQISSCLSVVLLDQSLLLINEETGIVGCKVLLVRESAVLGSARQLFVQLPIEQRIGIGS